MKKIAILAAAMAFALFASCSNDSGAAPGFYAGGITTTQTGPTGTAGDSSGSGGAGGTGGVVGAFGRGMSVRNYSKYSAIGAAASKYGFNASVSANASADSGESARLVGQDSNGNVEPLSVESDGKNSDINEQPLQFFRAFKRFVFFMYWPKKTEWMYYSDDYGKLFDYPRYYSTSVFNSSTGAVSYKYEPMYVLDKSNGKIYSIGGSESANDSNDVYNKWQAFSSTYGGNIAEAGDRFYISYSSYASNKSCINYYALKLSDDQLQETYIVKDADGGLFSGMYVDRFGNLFVNGSNSNIKYHIGFDGSKTRINCADCLYVYTSDRPLNAWIYYHSDGTFDQNLTGSWRTDYVDYYSSTNSNSSDYYEAMQPALHTPLFIAANGYVYQASKDSSSRPEVYKRYNADGQLEDCDWVPSASQEYYFTPDELVKEDGSVKYYFSNGSSGFYYYGQKTVENLQLYNSSGQPATVKKYDFDSSRYTDERIPIVLKSYNAYTYSATSKNSNTIYKVQFDDSSENKFTVTEIPLENYNSSSSYSYYYGCNSCAVTKKHIFYIQDNEIVAYNIEDGKKDAACCKNDALYSSICAGANSDKVSFTATSLSSNASISGTIDDNGLVEQNTTNYEIKYLSPIN